MSLRSGTLSSTKFCLNSCSHPGISEFNRSPVLNRGLRFYLVCDFWLAKSTTALLGFQKNTSLTVLAFQQHVYLTQLWLVMQTSLRKRLVSRQTTGFFILSCDSCFFVVVTALLSPFFFRPFARLFINLTVHIRSLFPKSATTLGHVEQTFWKMPFFAEWSGASSFEVILARPSIHFPTWASIPGSLLHESRRRIPLCRFCTLKDIVTETAIVSFRTLPVSFPFPTISWTSLFTLFYPLILDHGTCFIISISGLKILRSQILLDTSFHHRFQSVIIRS